MATTYPLPPNANQHTLEASICRASFKHFVLAFWELVPGTGKLKWSWHLDLICSELQKIAERVFQGLPKLHDTVLNISPGTSKSTLASILLPAWLWTRMPSCRILTASHADDLVLDLANKARTVIKSEKYQTFFPEIKLKSDQDSKGYYVNTMGGDRKTCTVGGKSPIGFHGHVLIVDDPLDPKKALSVAEMATARAFMTDVISTRKVDKAVSVTFLIMQRLGVGDPTEVMLEGARKEGGEKVFHICLPSDLDREKDGTWRTVDVVPEEIAGLYIDGLMDPVRLSRDVLRGYKARGELFFATQFRQKPYVRGGGMFKCLIADTTIMTDIGLRPIQDIKQGDKVYTRSGLKKVTWSGCSGKVNELLTTKYSNGMEITSTPDHRVWTENRGWVEAQHLLPEDEIISLKDISWKVFGNGSKEKATLGGFAGADAVNPCKSNPTTENEESPAFYMDIMPGRAWRELWSSMEFSTTDDPRAIMRGWVGKSLCTEQCGSTTTEKSRKGMTCITRTEIPAIITSPISNVCPAKSISENTGAERERRNSLSILKELPSDSQKTQRQRGGKKRKNSINVRGVVSNSRPEVVALSITAAVLVKRKDTVPVYDLEVEGDHEFFANGILVHNSFYFNQRRKAAPYNAKRIRYWDRASSEGRGCLTAGVLLAKDAEDNYWIEDVVVGQWEPNERNARMLATAQKDRARYGPKYEPTIYIEREGGSSGRDAWKSIAKYLDGFRVIEDAVTGDKTTRAEGWSSQCASMNVFVCDNGQSKGLGICSWDVEEYVKDHCAFPNGQFLDRIDASTGAYNIFVNRKHAPTLRSYTLSERGKKAPLRVVCCSREELQGLAVLERALLISFSDPPVNRESEVMCSEEGQMVAKDHVRPGVGGDDLRGNGQNGEPVTSSDGKGVMRTGRLGQSNNGEIHTTGDVSVGAGMGACPPHSLQNLLEHVNLSFCDFQPSQFQDTWEDPVPPWNLPPSQLIMAQEHGKKLWRSLLKKRPESIQIIVLVDDGDGRAISTAFGVCDILSLPVQCLLKVGDPDWMRKKEDEAQNSHVFSMVKSTRGLVIA